MRGKGGVSVNKEGKVKLCEAENSNVLVRFEDQVMEGVTGA